MTSKSSENPMRRVIRCINPLRLTWHGRWATLSPIVLPAPLELITVQPGRQLAR
jgi:hypothetical protein